RLAAKARTAGAEEDKRFSALTQTGKRGFGLIDVGGIFGDAQQRQIAALIVGLQSVEVRSRTLKPGRVCLARQAMLADCSVETSFNSLIVLSLAVLPAILHGGRNAPRMMEVPAIAHLPLTAKPHQHHGNCRIAAFLAAVR